MTDADAWAAAERALAPGEKLIWAEAAPANPATLIHFALALALIGLAIGVGWYLLKLWSTFLPGVRAFSTLISKALGFAALALTSAVLIALALFVLLTAFINGFKLFGDGAAVYAITDRQAMFVYDMGSEPYVEPLMLDVLRINRRGDNLHLGQPLSTELFGIVLDPAFYDLENAEAVEANLRELARVTTGVAAPEVQSPLPAPDTDVLRALAPALYANEQVVWAQRAQGRPYLIGNAPRAIIFGFLGAVLLLATFLTSKQEDRRTSIELRLIFGPVGAGLMLWAVSSAGWVFGSGHTYYALTDQRVVAVRTEPWRDARTFYAEYYEVITRGDWIRFCSATGRRRCSDRYISGVTDGEAVAQLIRETLGNESSAPVSQAQEP